MKMELLGQPLKKRTKEKESESARTRTSCNVRHNKKRRTHQLATTGARGRGFVVSAAVYPPDPISNVCSLTGKYIS